MVDPDKVAVEVRAAVLNRDQVQVEVVFAQNAGIKSLTQLVSVAWIWFAQSAERT